MLVTQAVRPVLARQDVATRQAAMPGAAPECPGAGAFARPDGAGPEHAPQLAAARQVRPVARAQREVLLLAGKITTRMGLRLRGTTDGLRPRRSWEPVVWIRPLGGLPRIYSRSADPVGQQREQVPATLTHGRERHVIPS